MAITKTRFRQILMEEYHRMLGETDAQAKYKNMFWTDDAGKKYKIIEDTAEMNWKVQVTDINSSKPITMTATYETPYDAAQWMETAGFEKHHAKEDMKINPELKNI